MQLKPFQDRALSTLGNFLAEVRVTANLTEAFANFAPSVNGSPAPYHPVPGLESVPYVCLRLPTGGGKTIVGAHAIRVVAENYSEVDYPFVLWMTPNDTIRKQTADALKDRRHPYREALAEVFGEKIEIYDADEIGRLRPADVRSRVCIVVATIQTFRVTNPEKRKKVYGDREDFEDFFQGANPAGLEKNGDRPFYSFQNLMRLVRPFVIVDEAHNIRTTLAFETLSGLAPAAVLELTATPDPTAQVPSNILVSVNVGELKDAEMVKLPILLTVNAEGWKQAVRDALREQRRLLEFAAAENDAGNDYVRPLMLVQAQNENQPANVAAVKAFLLELGVAESALKIATGTERELDDINLFDPATQVDVVITVAALREGWDCSFAYILCSVAELTTATGVEQLLGRVLRMPYARRRLTPELNQAYAYVVSQNFADTAQKLRDRMVENLGFTPAEAQQLIVPAPEPAAGLFASVIEVLRRPALNDLSESDQLAVRVRQSSEGQWSIELRDVIAPPLKARILKEVAPSHRPVAEARIAEHNRVVRAATAEFIPRAPFSVPQLYVTVDGQQELFTRSSVEDDLTLQLSDLPAQLPGFHYSPDTQLFAIDFQAGRLEVTPSIRNQPAFAFSPTEQTANQLISWLDGDVKSILLTSAQKHTWIRSLVDHWLTHQAVPLAKLFDGKFAIARSLRGAIENSTRTAANRGYQTLLDTAIVPLEDEFAFHFLPNNYNPPQLLQSPISFPKHLHRLIGDMNTPELECAVALEANPSVETWVRNVERDQLRSFKLPTMTDFFYPDFVAKLKGNSTLLLEYKGEMKVDEDAREKKQLGELWATRSGGRGLFAWITQRDSQGRDARNQIKSFLES